MLKKILVFLILAGLIIGINCIKNAVEMISKGNYTVGMEELAKGLIGGIGNLDNFLYKTAVCIKEKRCGSFAAAEYFMALILELLIMLAFISLTVDIVCALSIGVARYVLAIIMILLWIIAFYYLTHGFRGILSVQYVLHTKINVTKNATINI